MVLDYKKAKKNFLTAQIQGCRKFFEFNNYKLEQAYCEIIFDNLSKAKQLFLEIEDQDIRAHWGVFLIECIKGTISTPPTYFELRNFLEIDLNILITYNKGNYVEKLIRYADFMYTINPETHKFIGRAFLNQEMKPQAMFFLKRAKDYFYHDPELHYILASVYKEDKDYDLSKKSAETCLEVLPNYAPAKALLREITSQQLA